MSGEYVVLRSVLVSRRLDADAIVVGPTGLWVFEVKHWSGTVLCERGRWRRIKYYCGPGGSLHHQDEDMKPFDRQRLREAAAVEETLERRLYRLPQPASLIHGGLVFTHPEVQFDIDGSCGSGYGDPRYWIDMISGHPPVPGFTMELRLKVIDALLKWADRLQEDRSIASVVSSTSSSVELAEYLYGNAVRYAS